MKIVWGGGIGWRGRADGFDFCFVGVWRTFGVAVKVCWCSKNNFDLFAAKQFVAIN